MDLVDMLGTMPLSLQSITLHRSITLESVLVQKELIPALQHLRLENYNLVSVEWIAQFVQALKNQGRWDSFKRLDVIQ